MIFKEVNTMRTKLSNGQMVGICLASWAAVGNLLPSPVRGVAGFVLLNLMFLFAVGAIKC